MQYYALQIIVHYNFNMQFMHGWCMLYFQKPDRDHCITLGRLSITVPNLLLKF